MKTQNEVSSGQASIDTKSETNQNTNNTMAQTGTTFKSSMTQKTGKSKLQLSDEALNRGVPIYINPSVMNKHNVQSPFTHSRIEFGFKQYN